VPRQVVATPVMPKMGFWDRLLGVTQTIEPGETAGAVAGAAAPKAALGTAAVAGEAPVELGAVLGQGPTLAQKAAQAKVPLAGAAGGAAKTAAAAAAELGWKEAYQKGTGALLKKIATVATTKRPTAAGSFGKGLGSLFLIMLAQQLWSSLLQHGVLMPGGKGWKTCRKRRWGSRRRRLSAWPRRRCRVNRRCWRRRCWGRCSSRPARRSRRRCSRGHKCRIWGGCNRKEPLTDGGARKPL